MDFIYAELTVVWVITIVLGAILAVYHSGLVAYDIVKNVVENRRLRALDRLTSHVANTKVQAYIEAVE